MDNIDMLKVCPFCGSNKLKIDSKNGPIHYYEKDGMKLWQRVTFSVRCNSCKARGGPYGIDMSIDNLELRKGQEQKAYNEAIGRWNKRI